MMKKEYKQLIIGGVMLLVLCLIGFTSVYNIIDDSIRPEHCNEINCSLLIEEIFDSNQTGKESWKVIQECQKLNARGGC